MKLWRTILLSLFFAAALTAQANQPDVLKAAESVYRL